MNHINEKQYRKLVLRGWKIANRNRLTKDQIDLDYVNQINKFKQNNKIAVLVSSDVLAEDFEDGSKLIQTSGRAIAYLLDASYVAFKKFIDDEQKYADMPFSAIIDYPSNHFKFMEANNG